MQTLKIKAIDMLAGWGGFTEGATLAGVDVVFALNHNEVAVRAHARNYPGTRHVCGDARHYDYRAIDPFEMLSASPSCKPHSDASQAARQRPSERLMKFHDEQRTTPWCVLDCIEACRPRMFVIENVMRFRLWPLYRRWRECLIDLGYGVSEHRLLASRHGVPQRRQRLFVTGFLGKEPLRYTDPKVNEPAIGPHLQWGFGDWRPIDQCSAEVKSRIAAGRRRCGDCFITQHVTGHRGIALDEPIRTITTCDQFALVDGTRYRPLTLRETARAMGFRDDYAWPDNITRRQIISGFGNAVCPPVARDLITAMLDHDARASVRRPRSTRAATSRQELTLWS
jgi:DNA (cytosine-5)-methyltransferase 1